MNDRPKWHIDPEIPPKTPSTELESTAQDLTGRSSETSSHAWKRVQWTTYIRPEVLQALKKVAADRSNEARRRMTPADLLDEALGAYLKKYRN